MELDFLYCSICHELYKHPRTLPCLHSFCSSCIDRNLESNSIFNCTLCSQRFNCSNVGSTKFQTNYYLQHISYIESLRIIKDHSCCFCQLKGQTTKAINICIHCKDALCHSCSERHNSTRLTIDHKIFPLEKSFSEEFETEIRKLQILRCADHKDEEIKLYCSSCSIPICCDCLFNHKAHSLIDIKEAANFTRTAFTALNAEMKQKETHFNAEASKVETKIAEVEKLEKNLCGVVDNYADQIISRVKDETTKAKSFIRQETRRKKEALDSNQMKLTLQYSAFLQPMQLLDRICRNGKDEEMLYIWKLVEDNIYNLKKIDIPVSNLQLPQMSLRYSGHLVGSEKNLFSITVAKKEDEPPEKTVTKVLPNESQSNLAVKCQGNDSIRADNIYIEKLEASGLDKGYISEQKKVGKSIMDQNSNKVKNEEEVHRSVTPITTSSITSPTTLKLKAVLSISTHLPDDEDMPKRMDVAWVSESTFVVADEKNNKVTMFSIDGSVVCESSLNSPKYLGVMGDKIICSSIDSVYICSRDLKSIKRAIKFSDGRTPSPICCDQDYFIVSRSSWSSAFRLYRYDGTADCRIQINQTLINSRFIATAAKRSIIVSDRKSNKILAFDSNGKTMFSYKPADFNQWKPCGICSDDKENIYVADTLNSQIIKLLPDASKAALIPTSSIFEGPFGMSWKNGRLLITDNKGFIWICRLVNECILLRTINN